MITTVKDFSRTVGADPVEVYPDLSPMVHAGTVNSTAGLTHLSIRNVGETTIWLSRTGEAAIGRPGSNPLEAGEREEYAAGTIPTQPHSAVADAGGALMVELRYLPRMFTTGVAQVASSERTPDGELVISAAGQTFAGWTGISVTRTVEGMPARFQVQGTAKFPGDLRGLIPINSTCTVLIGGHVVLTGYFEIYNHAIGTEENNAVLAGRGRCCDLVDCAARMTNQTAVQTSIVDLAKRVVQSFAKGAIQVIAPDGDGAGQRFNLTIDLDETPYELIERIARYEGLLTYQNADGNVVLARVGKVSHASGFAEGQNVRAADYSLRVDQRFSTYTPLLMSSDPYSHDGSGGYGGNRAGQDVVDPGIDRYRPRIIVSEAANNDGSLATQRARWEAIQRAERGYRLSLIPTAGWIAPARLGHQTSSCRSRSPQWG